MIFNKINIIYDVNILSHVLIFLSILIIFAVNYFILHKNGCKNIFAAVLNKL